MTKLAAASLFHLLLLPAVAVQWLVNRGRVRLAAAPRRNVLSYGAILFLWLLRLGHLSRLRPGTGG